MALYQTEHAVRHDPYLFKLAAYQTCYVHMGHQDPNYGRAADRWKHYTGLDFPLGYMELICGGGTFSVAPGTSKQTILDSVITVAKNKIFGSPTHKDILLNWDYSGMAVAIRIEYMPGYVETTSMEKYYWSGVIIGSDYLNTSRPKPVGVLQLCD